MAYNNTFRRPVYARPVPTRSPSPPRAFIEPLSPPKPVPIEPNFNYPALNNPLTFTAAPEPAFTATPRSRAYSTEQNRGHQRRPSNIDTLAEAALAVSPSVHVHSRDSSAHFQPNGFHHAHPPQQGYGVSEPPHKRARSENFPTPQVGFQASRPATSYEPNAWPYSTQAGHGYERRFEEAELLLNFQSGGWPKIAPAPARSQNLPLAAGSVPRPHANSFPQQSAYARRPELVQHQEVPPLPVFCQIEARPVQQPALPPQRLADVAPMVLEAQYLAQQNHDTEMADVSTFESTSESTGAPLDQLATPTDDNSSRDESVDVSVNEITDAPKRRGWPKGKPRGPGARKTMAEKAASKRATARKKHREPKLARNKSLLGPVVPLIVKSRRKSLSDVEQQATYHEDLPDVSRAHSLPPDNYMLVRESTAPKLARRKVDVRPDTICAGCQTSRETANSHGEFDEWISCNGCKKWYHIDCAGFKRAHDVRDVDKYFCDTCETQHGKTTYVRKSTRAHASVDYAELQRGVLKTSEESVEHHYIKPIKDGTFQFDPEGFPRMPPEMVTRDFFEKSGMFTEPICIPAAWNPRPWAANEAKSFRTTDSEEASAQSDTLAEAPTEDFEYSTIPDHGQDRLEMVMPQGLSVRSVCNLVGGDWPIDVIDVKTQNSGAKWTLSRWADYYEETSDDKEIRNVISLEVSQTKLGRLLQRPKIVRDLDLQDDVWPQEEIDKGKFPKVQFYCLMSIADSYTDFHIDFGGSSVYYHILKGKKTFLFIPPKAKHLKAYEEWNDSPQQNYTFLPSITKECYRVDLSEGDTMLIPSGWIHAVWTPEDSLVIGGNFLNRLSYKNQFRVVEIEKNNETPMKFRYPSFQKVMWYTAIKYLETDPLPSEVSQAFWEGKRFEREVPVWGDFDGDVALNDDRVGAANSRYYSQAEMEGLPELVNYIFRTVMLVMGRVEGISADRMKRVNASIPKGYGEPLELAKAFALWVAWKRGNEDPPAWAHPDAVLPSSKDEGTPKKLSERKLKELERKEAIAAWRVVPDRQSARVISKVANSATSGDALPSTSSPAPTQSPTSHQMQIAVHQNQQYAPSPSVSAPSLAPYMTMHAGSHFLSTPKTSVLGPKRVACDACRKRRIKCKHKDLVQQIPTVNGGLQAPGSIDPALRASLGSEMGDNITVSPSRQGGDGQIMMNATTNGDGVLHLGAQPGTSAYITQNIPMTMNGVPMFGEMKRGRSKACYECRRSKRRCIHDDNGNVDPNKAAEPPVPRAAIAGKKRQSSELQSPMLKKIKLQTGGSPAGTPVPMPPSPQQMVAETVLEPAYVDSSLGNQTLNGDGAHTPSRNPSHPPPPLSQPPQQPPNVDPELFTSYTHSETNGTYGDHDYDYHHDLHAQSYHMPNGYQIPSLEQIANEVLDMSGNDSHEHGALLPDGFDQIRAFNADDAISNLPNGPPQSDSKPDGSVDSAVSLPVDGTQESSQDEKEAIPTDGVADPGESHGVAALPKGGVVPNGLPTPLPSVKESTAQPQSEHVPAPGATNPTTSPIETKKDNASDLPLWQPPAPLTYSPEIAKRQIITNGVHSPSKSPEQKRTDPASSKRKRDSMPSNSEPRVGKRTKVNGTSESLAAGQEGMTGDGADGDEESRSVELARLLQQEDLGLRRRSSRGSEAVR